jgi:hypothetical protein
MSAVRPRGNKSYPPRQAANTGDVNSRENNPQPGFNPHICLNLFCNVASQIETETRSAVRDPNPKVAHAFLLKAEGPGYALRLLYGFEPEFRELVKYASLRAEITNMDSTV